MTTPARRRPPLYVQPFAGEPGGVYRVEPWSVWCDYRRHAALLDVWQRQVRWFDNDLEILAGEAAAEFLDRFWDVVDARIRLIPDLAEQYRATATAMTARLHETLPTHATDLDDEDDDLDEATFGMVTDRKFTRRPSAWLTADALVLALEQARPAFEYRIAAPRRRVWSVGADLTLCLVHTIEAVHDDGPFRVPDPTDPFGLFEHRRFRYEHYLTTVPVDDGDDIFAVEPAPDGDPFGWDWLPVNGPLGAYLEERAEPWMKEACARVYGTFHDEHAATGPLAWPRSHLEAQQADHAATMSWLADLTVDSTVGLASPAEDPPGSASAPSDD